MSLQTGGVMRKFVALILLALATSAQGQESGNRLNLICGGQGAANKQTATNVYGWDSDGNTGGATINGTRSVGFGDEVALWIEGEDGKLRMPRAMLPAIRGGENGWFKLKSIVVTDREITASVAVNALNNPKMRLDRTTGSISLSGKAGDYSGGCEKYDPDSTKRKF